MADDIDCPCGETHTADDMRAMQERIVGPQTRIGAPGHVVPTEDVPRCECRECKPGWCDGNGPAYRRERKRHPTESRWLGEWNVCTRCTKTPPIFENIEYPDEHGAMRKAHVRWLVAPDTDLAPYQAWDEDFSHYFPLCACGCPRYMHADGEDECFSHDGDPDAFVRKEHCTAWRPQAALGQAGGDPER